MSDLDMPDNPYDPVKRGQHGITYMSMPHKYRIDYLLQTDFGKVIGIAEVKWYFANWYSKNHTIHLSMLKINDILTMADNFGCRPYFIIRVRDGAYYWKVDKQFVQRGMIVQGGRVDRGEPGDIEPMLSVPDRYWNPFHVGKLDMSPGHV